VNGDKRMLKFSRRFPAAFGNTRSVTFTLMVRLLDVEKVARATN